jgi:hypothetical protein
MKLDFSRQIFESNQTSNLTLNPVTWKIWRAPHNDSRWQMGFNSAFKGLKKMRPERAELFHADGRSYIHVASVHNFTNALERSKLSLSTPWMHLGGAEVIIRTLDGGGWLILAPAALPPGKNFGMLWKGRWVGQRCFRGCHVYSVGKCRVLMLK